MTGRHFPDNQEVDEWISTHFLSEADADASPVVDQLKAATAEAVTRFQAAAPGMVASGLGRWAALNIPDHDRSRIRGAVRMVIAAESAGLLPLCQHVNQIQPLIMVCDPPVMICTSCFASRQTVIEALGHRWNHECDRCGVHVQQLSAVTIGGLGHITVSGHLCSRCTAADARLAAQQVDQVVVVGNRRARRRGGAR